MAISAYLQKLKAAELCERFNDLRESAEFGKGSNQGVGDSLEVEDADVFWLDVRECDSSTANRWPIGRNVG